LQATEKLTTCGEH